MTQYPEAYLARELGICYASIALITDYDVGVEGVDGVVPVTQAEVFGFFERNVEQVRDVLRPAIRAMPRRMHRRARRVDCAGPACICLQAARSVRDQVPFPLGLGVTAEMRHLCPVVWAGDRIAAPARGSAPSWSARRGRAAPRPIAAAPALALVATASVGSWCRWASAPST